MLDEQSSQDFASRYAESMRDGKSPREFIALQVAQVKSAVAKQEEGQMQFGNGDIAYIIQLWADQGVIKIPEIDDVEFLQTLGLTLEEAKVFVPETLPQIREFIKEQQRKELKEAEARNNEYANQFTKAWGLERLDEIGNYYLKNSKKLEETDRYWQENIKRYQSQRERLGKDFELISDPFQKAQFLMRQAYYLTYLHPSELQQVFNAERDTDTHPYLDSLLNVSSIMFKNGNGKDPDFDSVHMQSGNISMTVSVFRADDQDSIRRLSREKALEGLVFGAKKTNEVTGLTKTKIFPLAPRQEIAAPSK